MIGAGISSRLCVTPATKIENIGNSEHKDGNCITFVFQDEAGGLQVRKEGEWIPVMPAQGTIVVNVGDVIQVVQDFSFSFILKG